jgi:hypothetical protein
MAGNVGVDPAAVLGRLSETKLNEPPKHGGSGDDKPKTETVNLWDERAEFIRKNCTTPRDLFERDGTAVKSGIPDLKKHVRFAWLSDRFLDDPPMRSHPEIWQPVDEALIKKWQLKLNTRQRTDQGIPKWGKDVMLYWAPNDIVCEMEKFDAELADPRRQMQKTQEELRKELGSDAGILDKFDEMADESFSVGNVEAGSRQLQQRAEQEAHRGLGRRLG